MIDLFRVVPLGDDDQFLVAAYEAAGRTLDDLPYTNEFESLFRQVTATNPQRSRRDVFHRLHNLRKAARLPRLGRTSNGFPRIPPEEEALLAGMVVDRVGTLGQRDQLPYDPRIDDLAQEFNAKTGRSLTQHDIWRLVAKLAK